MTLTDYFNRTIDRRRREYNHKGYAPGVFKGDRGGGSGFARQIRTWYVGRHAELYSISDGISIQALFNSWARTFNNWAQISSRSEWDREIDEIVRYSGTRKRRQGNDSY